MFFALYKIFVSRFENCMNVVVTQKLGEIMASYERYIFIDSNIANFDSRCITKTFRIVGIDLKIHNFRKRWKCILHCDKLSNNKLLIDQCVGLQILILPSLVLTILLWIFCQSKYFIDSTKFNLIHEGGESKNYVKQLILK